MLYITLPNGKTIIYNNNLYYSNNGIPTQLALQSLVQSIQSTVNSQQSIINNLQNNAYTSNRKPYIVGHYQGNGSERVISVGFRPTAVFLMSNGYMTDGNNAGGYGGLSVTNSNAKTIERQSGEEIITITSNGFTVYRKSFVITNDSELFYNYIAFK